jgi:succinyl-CoA synthetase beta subunit
VDLFEYQAREIFAKHGVPVLDGDVAASPEEARHAAERLGRGVVVKAQVKTGGRGKAGGIKVATSPDDAAAKAGEILGLDIKGHVVRKVMLAETADIAAEYYVSYLLDRANRTFLAMASVEGGMDIEEVATTKPEALAKMAIDPLTGVDMAKAREIVDAANFPADIKDQVAEVLVTLWQVFTAEDAHSAHLLRLTARTRLDDCTLEQLSSSN